MLILVRKRNQSITIARDVQLTVLEISGKAVKLGITGPQEIVIRRVTGPHPTPRIAPEFSPEK